MSEVVDICFKQVKRGLVIQTSFVGELSKEGHDRLLGWAKLYFYRFGHKEEVSTKVSRNEPAWDWIWKHEKDKSRKIHSSENDE
jgi:hypothetical protein